MKKIIHKSMSLFMASVVLMATMSFTMDMHFCGDTFVDYSFSQSADTCGMELSSTTTNCENNMLSQKSCCNDTQLIKQGNDDLKISFSQLSHEQQLFVATFTYSYLNLLDGTTSQETPFFDYAPPFIEQDVQILHQTFLI
ncbi:HYC_CC_PP family protein [Nonlabens antarcticus]